MDLHRELRPAELAFWDEMARGFARDVRAAVASILASDNEVEIEIDVGDDPVGNAIPPTVGVNLVLAVLGRLPRTVEVDSGSFVDASRIEVYLRKILVQMRSYELDGDSPFRDEIRRPRTTG